MKRLLIADDDENKIKWLKLCIRAGPADIRSIPTHIARTTQEAVRLILEHSELAAGFIDYDIPAHNGPHIIKEWRRIEMEQHRSCACISLATNAVGDSFENYKQEALAAGADDAICLRYNNDKNPAEAVCEILEKMRAFLLT